MKSLGQFVTILYFRNYFCRWFEKDERVLFLYICLKINLEEIQLLLYIISKNDVKVFIYSQQSIETLYRFLHLLSYYFNYFRNTTEYEFPVFNFYFSPYVVRIIVHRYLRQYTLPTLHRLHKTNYPLYKFPLESSVESIKPYQSIRRTQTQSPPLPVASARPSSFSIVVRGGRLAGGRGADEEEEPRIYLPEMATGTVMWNVLRRPLRRG